VRAWKWLGLAGIAGVAATGAVVARAERRRQAYTPDDVRARLHERLEQAGASDDAARAAAEPTAPPAAHRPRRRHDADGCTGSRAALAGAPAAEPSIQH
jgi:hypothetical protein